MIKQTQTFTCDKCGQHIDQEQPNITPEPEGWKVLCMRLGYYSSSSGPIKHMLFCPTCAAKLGWPPDPPKGVAGEEYKSFQEEIGALVIRIIEQVTEE